MNKRFIERSFSRAAKNYDIYSNFQKKSGKYLFKCLSVAQGKTILDAGCGTGYFSKKWKHFGKNVIALDISLNMLSIAQNKRSAMCYINGDIEFLPLKNESVDLCFSNLVIQWCSNMFIALSELNRITKNGGVIAFSTLADGSLKELKECLKKVNKKDYVNSFLTFEEIKDNCKQWNHSLEEKYWKFSFPSLKLLLNSIKCIGASYSLNKNKARGLMTKTYLSKLFDNYPIDDDEFPLTYRVVFGMLYK